MRSIIIISSSSACEASMEPKFLGSGIIIHSRGPYRLSYQHKISDNSFNAANHGESICSSHFSRGF